MNKNIVFIAIDMAAHTTQKIESSKVKLPSGFSKKTTQVAISILLFFIIYVAFVALFIRLFVITFTFGLNALEENIGFWTLLIFVGTNGFVIGVLYHLLKVFFPPEKNGGQKEVKIQITEQQYPELFKIIYEVADKVNTHRPRKVYLLPDVNASVFHDQNILSLFSASRQNLNIGLGLVAVVSKDELKAVLAHEFGHFSQNITRISGFIYRINKLILELLYTDGGWGQVVATSAQIHWVITIFAGLTVKAAGVIRWVFQKVYGLVNISFLSLSRDLEFHADAVSVSIYGREALKNALRKFDFANVAYAKTADYLNKYFEKQIICKNFYKVFATRIEQVALRNEIGLKNGQLLIDDTYLEKRVISRIITKDQWASHPSDKDREENINRSGESKPYDETSAWEIFAEKAEPVQEEITNEFYKSANVNIKGYNVLSAASIIEKITAEENETEVSGVFNHFYFQRALDIDVDDALAKYNASNAALLKFDDIFSKENRNKMYKLFQNQADKAVLEAINEKKLKVSFFEFDNIKYRRGDCENLLSLLNKEITEAEQWLKELDTKSFWASLYLAEKIDDTKKEEFITLYKDFISTQQFLVSLTTLTSTINYQLTYTPVLVSNDEKLTGYLLNLRNAETTSKNSFLKLNYKRLITEEIVSDEVVRKFTLKYIENSEDFVFSLHFIQDSHLEVFYQFVGPLDKYIGVYYSKMLKKLTDTQLQLAGKF